MKKILYFVLLIAELVVGALLMYALYDSAMYIPVAIAAVALAASLVWHVVLLVKAADDVAKRMVLLRIALIMLIPCAVFAVTYIGVGIAFIIAFV